MEMRRLAHYVFFFPALLLGTGGGQVSDGEPNFLAVYRPWYDLPLNLDGQQHSLRFSTGVDPTGSAREWCTASGVEGVHGCASAVAAAARTAEEEHKMSSRGLLASSAYSTGRPLVVEAPLAGECFVGPNPGAVVAWPTDDGGACASITSGPAGALKVQIVARFRPRRFRARGDPGADPRVHVVAREGLSAAAVKAGKWEGSLLAYPGADGEMGVGGTLEFSLELPDAAPGSFPVACQSGRVEVAQVSATSGPVLLAVERGDRHGAVVHSALLRSSRCHISV